MLGGELLMQTKQHLDCVHASGNKLADWTNAMNNRMKLCTAN